MTDTAMTPRRCPACEQAMSAEQEKEESPEALLIRSTTEALIQEAERLRLFMSADLRVDEKGAAKLLGISHTYLRDLRQAGESPMHYALGVNGSRLSYRLIDLASWIESRHENPFKYRCPAGTALNNG